MASFRRLAFVCAVPAAALAIWQGCSVYDNSLLPSDAAADAGSDVVNVPDSNGCVSATWPGRPLADDDASVDDIVFYQAIEMLDFGAGDSGATVIGYDLDNVCTCEGNPPGPDSCIPFAEAGTQCDLEGGVDNSAGLLIQEFAGSGNFFDQGYVNAQIAAGIFGALFRVTNYNGTANDTNVEVSIYTSNGTQGAGTDAGPKVPQWNGTDVWTLDPTSLLGGTIGDAGPIPFVAYDLNAYVANWTLVSNISDMPLAIGAATGEGLVTIDLTGAHVVAKLTPVGNTFKATGTVTGRWESSKLLTSLAVLYDPFQMDASLCGNDPVYQLLKPRVCALEDIATNVLDDGTNAPCDALSLAFNFTSVAATYGSVFAKPDGGGGGCGPQWTDQCGP
jgi:hypothetical protein